MAAIKTLEGTPDRNSLCPYADLSVAKLAGEQALKQICADCRAGIEINSGGEALGFTGETDAITCYEYTLVQKLIATGRE